MRSLTAALAIVATLGLAPTLASAASFEDSYADCTYPPVFDLILLRPIGFSSLVVGTGLFIPYSLVAIVATPGGVAGPMKSLVVDPFRFTFRRPLGECAESAREL
ncbi:MAG: hypothetical protein ACE5IL_05465 [Myxococcota bacterium]